MDKLAERLKTDASMIDAPISDELDRRIAASLQGIVPEKPAVPAKAQRSAVFWWASSLTGAAASLAVIAVINSQSQPANIEPMQVDMSPLNELKPPTIEWKTKSAVLTKPLQDELANLQSDIKKAEETVKRDIGL